MTIRAFKDSDDGYYQIEVKDGEPLPEWTKALTPCAVQAAAGPTEKEQAKAQIADLEQKTLMNRAVREFMLLSAEAQAAAQGITPAQLYVANPAYKSVKDVETQIVALRAKMK